jgi:hypothetical protein
MLRLPVHGFAKRVDDTVARAMTFLRARDELTVKRYQPVLPSKSKEQTRSGGRERKVQDVMEQTPPTVLVCQSGGVETPLEGGVHERG